MDRLKVILVHDGSRGSTASFDQGALPEGIEIVGSLRIDGLSAGNNPRDGQPSMSDKAGLHPRISGEADLHPGVSEDIAGLVQRGSKHQVPDRVFPLSEPGGIEERPVRLTRTCLLYTSQPGRIHGNEACSAYPQTPSGAYCNAGCDCP